MASAKSASAGKTEAMLSQGNEVKVNQFLSYFGHTQKTYHQYMSPFADEPRLKARFIFLSRPLYYFEYGSDRYHLSVSLIDDQDEDHFFDLSVDLDNYTGEFAITFERAGYLPPDHFLWTMLPRIRQLLGRISQDLGIRLVDHVLSDPQLHKFKMEEVIKQAYDTAANETGHSELRRRHPDRMRSSIEVEFESISWANIATYKGFRQQALPLFKHSGPRSLLNKIRFIQTWARALAQGGILPMSAVPEQSDITEDDRLIKEDRRARAEKRLAEITAKKQEDARQQAIQGRKAEISTIIDGLNRALEKKLFDNETKERIAEKVSTWELVKGRPVLVVGHSGSDYLPILLAKLGLKVSVIDIDPKRVKEQNGLHRQFGLEQEIESFESYADLRDRKFDYITVFAVINDAIDAIETDQLVQLGVLSTVAEGENRQRIEKLCKEIFELQIRKFIIPILVHLNPDGGHILVNMPGMLSNELLEKFPDDFSTFGELVYYLNSMMPSLCEELAVSFTSQPQMDVDDFSMHPTWLRETRVGIVYRATTSQASKLTESLDIIGTRRVNMAIDTGA
jgi:hypothetical protein